MGFSHGDVGDRAARVVVAGAGVRDLVPPAERPAHLRAGLGRGGGDDRGSARGRSAGWKGCSSPWWCGPRGGSTSPTPTPPSAARPWPRRGSPPTRRRRCWSGTARRPWSGPRRNGWPLPWSRGRGGSWSSRGRSRRPGGAGRAASRVRCRTRAGCPPGTRSSTSAIPSRGAPRSRRCGGWGAGVPLAVVDLAGWEDLPDGSVLRAVEPEELAVALGDEDRRRQVAQAGRAHVRREHRPEREAAAIAAFLDDRRGDLARRRAILGELWAGILDERMRRGRGADPGSGVRGSPAGSPRGPRGGLRPGRRGRARADGDPPAPHSR